MSAEVYSAPSQTEGIRKAFLDWASIYLSPKLSLACRGNVDCYKNVHRRIPILLRGIGNTLAIP